MTDRKRPSEDAETIVRVLKSAFGCSDSPTAPPAFLEGISMALAGDHFAAPIGPALVMIADALNRIADALEARS